MNKNAFNIIKRSGNKEQFQLEKWQAQIAKACEDVSDVSSSMIEVNAKAFFYDGMTTRELDQITLRSMIDLIDEIQHPDVGNVNYQYAAGKQRISMLYKDIYGEYKPHRLYDIVVRNVEKKLYTPELLEWYTEAEWDSIDAFIDHKKDELLPYAAVEQLVDKYLVQNRATKEVVETPQIRYAVASATAFHAEKTDRLKWVKDAYEESSNGKFTLATPVLAGLGTKTKQFSSCVLIKSNDSLDSIYATGQVMARYASKKAGIGLEMGRLRALGSPIRNGEIAHMGSVLFLQKWLHDLKATSAGGLRNSAATITYPIWHSDFEDWIVLKNNQGTNENRVRHLDYSVVVSSLFWRRFKEQKNITFFDPNDVPELYEAFYRDIDAFDMMYERYEKRTDLKTKIAPAETVFKDMLLKERRETGRIYILNIDNVQRQGSFDSVNHPVYQSNLCFSGDTQVAIVGANAVRMADLVDREPFRVYSAVKTAMGAGWSTVTRTARAIFTGQRELVRVWLDSGEYFDATPDHRLATTAFGEWVTAGESLGKDLEPFTTPVQFKARRPRLVVKVEKLAQQDCFDIQVLDENLTDNEHNFYIVTSGDGVAENTSGVLVHNCQEIMLPTTPFETIEDENGLIALCTLGSMNWGAVKSPEDMKKPLKILARLLHNLLQYQDFLTPQSARHNKMFEPLGIGITNLAYWHAKRKMKYGEADSLAEVKLWIEHQNFYLTEASVDLAKEKGACTESHNTCYGKGDFIWERRNPGVNELTDFTPAPSLDWEKLRAKMIKYGVRHATTGALPPVESSSVVVNSTNGFSMVKELIAIKSSKAGEFAQVVPEYKKYGKYYEKMFDQADCAPFLKTVAVLQAYTDQGISADTFYSPKFFPGGKVPITLVAKNLMLAHKWGFKSHYYDLSDKAGMVAMLDDAKTLDDGFVDSDEVCESCTL